MFRPVISSHRERSGTAQLLRQFGRLVRRYRRTDPRRAYGRPPATHHQVQARTCGAVGLRSGGRDARHHMPQMRHEGWPARELGIVHRGAAGSAGGCDWPVKTPPRKLYVKSCSESGTFTAFHHFCRNIEISKLRVFNAPRRSNSRRLHHLSLFCFLRTVLRLRSFRMPLGEVRSYELSAHRAPIQGDNCFCHSFGSSPRAIARPLSPQIMRPELHCAP